MTLTAVSARSWGDLDEGEHEIYGREREEKLPIRFFFVQKEDWKDHYAFHILFLWATKSYPRYESGRLLPFYYWLQSKVDNRYQLITPVYYHEVDGKDRDNSALWLYYWGERGDVQKTYSGLFPLYYYSSYRGDSPFILTPLFWYSRHSYEKSTAYSFGAPIIPLVIWDSSPSEWDLIFFYLMRHRTRPSGTLSHALPLYYYSNHQGEGSVFISPLYYASTDALGKGRSLLWLIYWGETYAPEGSYHGVFPLYYYSKRAPEMTTLVSPLYWTFSGQKSNFELLIPLYLSYQKGDYSLHVNAAGLSFSEERLSSLPVGVQVRGDKISIDSDFGWFYNLFRVSARKTVDRADSTPAAVNPPAVEKPQVTNRRARNRDESDSFFGIYSLFGIFAYERADHYRHFRLLPLSWLTWDSNNDTGVQTLLPFYVHYKDEAVRYLVVGAVLPLYGKQQKFHANCTSEISTFLVIVYWNEFDCEEKKTEKTVLWPIVNHYASPIEGGYRIFPVFWKKWWLEGGREKQKHFSPLHYTTIDGENFSTLSWLFYRSRDNEESTFGIWALFHRSKAHNDKAQQTYIFPVYYGTREYEGQGPVPRRDSLFTFAGLFWRYHETQNAEDQFTMHISPLYLYFAEKDRGHFYSWLYYGARTPQRRTAGIPLLFHRRADTNGDYSNFYLLPFYHSRQNLGEGQGESTVFWLFPLYYRERSPGYAFDNVAFIAGRKTNEQANAFSWNALLYTLWYEREQKSTHFRLGYALLFNYSDTDFAFSWHFALISGYKYELSGAYARHHLLPLWWHSRSGSDTNLYLLFLLSKFQNHDNGNRLFRAVLLGILYYHNSDAAAYDQTEHVLLGTAYYHTKNFEIDPATRRERRFDSYGSLWGGLWHYESEESYKRFSLLTFVYIRTEKDGEVRNKIFGIPF